MPVFSVDASKVTISRVVVYRHSGIRTVGPFKGLSETMTGDVDVLEGHRGSGEKWMNALMDRGRIQDSITPSQSILSGSTVDCSAVQGPMECSVSVYKSMQDQLLLHYYHRHPRHLHHHRCMNSIEVASSSMTMLHLYLHLLLCDARWTAPLSATREMSLCIPSLSCTLTSLTIIFPYV